MAVIPQPSASQQASPLHPIQNLGNTAAHPVIVMAHTPAPVKQTELYGKRFPKKFILPLSIIQLVMAVLAIITQAIGLYTDDYYGPGFQIVGTGIWCGIFFALSGVFGAIASSKPSFGWIVTFMVFSIISASFSLPLLVLSSIGTVDQSYYYYFYPGDPTRGYVVSAIQIVISLVQAAAAIVSAGMTCRAVCKCCGARREFGAVDYNGSGGSNLNNAASQHITLSEPQPAYITIPMSQIQVLAASAGATALPTISRIPGTAETDVIDNSAPPKYDTVAKMKEDKEEENGDISTISVKLNVYG